MSSQDIMPMSLANNTESTIWLISWCSSGLACHSFEPCKTRAIPSPAPRVAPVTHARARP